VLNVIGVVVGVVCVVCVVVVVWCSWCCLLFVVVSLIHHTHMDTHILFLSLINISCSACCS